MTTYKAVWIGDEATLEGVGVLLTDVHFPPADAVSLTKHDDAAPDDGTQWKLEAYFAEQPDADALAALLSESGAGAQHRAQVKDWRWQWIDTDSYVYQTHLPFIGN